MKKEYIAQFRASEQFSPDDWKEVTPTLKVSDETTIGEIRAWMEKIRHSQEREFKVILIDKP